LVCVACRPTPDQVWKDAQLSLRRGELKIALKDADIGLQRYPSENSEWHWRFRALKAEVLDRQGFHAECFRLLEVEPPASFAKSDMAVRRKYTQGITSAWLQRAAEARRFLLEAETLAKENHPELLGEVSLRSGAVDYLASDWEAAATAYRDALVSSRQQNDLYVQTAALGGLAAVATKQERYDESIDWSEAALRLAKTLDLQGSLGYILGNMAWNYSKLGDFDAALDFYEQAGQASARSGLVPQQIYWLSGTADVYYEQHNYGAAEAALTRGLPLARSQGNKRTLTDYLNGLAEAELETGRAESAEKHYEEATGLEENSLDRSQLLASQLVRGRIGAEKHDYPQAEKSFRGVTEDPKADMSQKWEAEARLARVYADTGRTAEAEVEFRRAVAVIEAARASVPKETLRLSFLSSAISFYDDYIDFLISQHRMDDALRLAEVSRARTLEEGLGTSTEAEKISLRRFPPEQVAQRLKAALLFYWLGEKHSYLWVITPGKTTCLTLPAASRIDPLVKAYREAVARSNDVAETEKAAGEELYATLVAPAQKFIAQNSRVILLPDGSLYSLNFETLIAPEPRPHFWIEDVTITTASSLSLLASAASRTLAKQKNLLLVGDALKASDEFEQLPQAEDEMKAVEGYFPEAGRTVLKREQATPAAYLASNPERYAYLHFVTHGTASRAQPLDSAVILSREPASDTYKLYARDIVTRHLNAELVTISACNGSGTRAYSGEGLVGLSWAFVRAGAHNVIAALWEVSNAPSTTQLMDSFYKGLSHGEDPATALREAKLSFLRSSSAYSVFKKPYYWAPFQLYAGS
jgi:CHAT domain-containing protein